MSKRQQDATPAVPRVYEGEAILAPLLQSLGARMDVAGLKEAIRAAQERGEAAAGLFPTLFEKPPRFGSPEQAVRLWGNLFGLWDRIASGGPVEPASPQPRAAAEEQSAPEPSPRPEPLGDGPLTDAFVQAAWRHLGGLPERELEKLSHRFDNTQSELAELVQFEAGESNAAIDTADTLAFEIWAILGMARPDGALRSVSVEEFHQARASSDPIDPALDRYLTEIIGEAELSDEEPLSEEDAPEVLELARAVARAFAAQGGNRE